MAKKNQDRSPSKHGVPDLDTLHRVARARGLIGLRKILPNASMIELMWWMDVNGYAYGETEGILEDDEGGGAAP